jgi:hypothetical protein
MVAGRKKLSYRNWSVKKIEVSVGWETLHVSTEKFKVYYTFVSVNFNGILKFSWTVKIGAFGTFEMYIKTEWITR